MKLKYSISLIRSLLLGLICVLSFLDLPAQPYSGLFGTTSTSTDSPKDFAIDLQVIKLDEDIFQLVSTIDLDKEAFIISPFSKDEFYLPYTNTILQNSFIKPSSELIEFPASVEEMDPYIEKRVKYIRQKTVFTQAYKMLESKNFVVNGLIEFLVEPSCIPYDITFEIKNHAGVLSIENLKVIISEEYKR